AKKCVVPPAEKPLRIAELGLLVRDLLALSVEVPPAVPVGHPVELAVGTPRRLPDRLAGPAGNLARGRWVVERSHPQLGAVPRHVGVVPARPAHLRAVGARTR